MGRSTHLGPRLLMLGGAWLLLTASATLPTLAEAPFAASAKGIAAAPHFVDRHSNPAGAFMPHQFGASRR